MLLVEDNPVNQLVATRMLQLEGCEVDLAANGAEAVERAQVRTLRPDPDGLPHAGDGRLRGDAAAARRSSDASARPPILALTASVLDEDRKLCRQAGMDAALAKPLQRAALAAALAHWVHRRAA